MFIGFQHLARLSGKPPNSLHYPGIKTGIPTHHDTVAANRQGHLKCFTSRGATRYPKQPHQDDADARP